MFIAAEAANAASSTSNFNVFDIFMILFTIIIAWGLFRLMGAKPKRNLFAIGFTAVSLAVFLFIDYVMVFKVWLS
ncbi:hypothetical protein [Paenibacillus beijingensis]|uniref:DUF2759 domain-containing protein n=1 Tax=Paenibacillus beijingensis TaxID=1126833 RepID=A0A0D5NJR6_9BACL|nr:hypothetical protein [Paenibacillus beijingensis]AJY75232.1 hypothetical protein VN24_12400 [Paenibacillus beijingensis]